MHRIHDPIGRPRDLASKRSILSATMSLLQSTSVSGLVIEAVAREAKVSKATIYRWWDSKLPSGAATCGSKTRRSSTTG
ncbi:TetR/AcrR family transcriptional regulator [Bradyrhizobium sp. ma5]|uniref:TetR/AcrR family transcriptional regulator n=1 Tax=Bradyrhizobium sp. ma5 TaxID=3344828 RepID=UPI0035D40A7B